MKYIDLADDVKKLDSVTKIKGKKIDSLSYLIKPTRSEFKKILKINDLGREEEYTKTSK
jgi:preprotein translocase subunit Sss1